MAQGSAKKFTLGVGVYAGTYRLSYMDGLGYLQSNQYYPWFESKWINSFNSTRKYLLLKEVYLTVNKRFDLYYNTFEGHTGQPIDYNITKAQIWSKDLIINNIGARYHFPSKRLSIAIGGGYASRDYFEGYIYTEQYNITGVQTLDGFEYKNKGMHASLQLQFLITKHLGIVLKYQYHYFFLSDADKVQVQNSPMRSFPFYNTNYSSFFENHRANYQSSTVSLGLTLRIDSLVKFGKKKLSAVE